MTCNWPYHHCVNLGMTAADALMLLREKAHAAYPPGNPMSPYMLPPIEEAIVAAENYGCVDVVQQCQNLKDALDHADNGDWGDVIIELEQLGDPGDLVASTGSSSSSRCDFTRFPRSLQRALYVLARHMGRDHERASSDEVRDKFWACMVDYAEEFKKR